jgi:hypothetical protein
MSFRTGLEERAGVLVGHVHVDIDRDPPMSSISGNS